MNLTNLILWAASIITALAGIRNIDEIQIGILRAQAKLIYESRTETWGAPKFLGKENAGSKPSKKITSDRGS